MIPLALGDFTPQILNGLSYGFSIALIAIGLTLIFGVMDIVNFAHGEFYMLGGYAIWILTTDGDLGLGLIDNFWVAVVVAILLVAVVSVVIFKLTILPIVGRDPIESLIVTFGLVLILQQVAFELFGGQVRSLVGPVSGATTFMDITYPTMRLLIIVASSIIVLLTYVLLEKTNMGIYIKASAEDIETARSLGVPAERIFYLVFVLSAVLAVIAAAFLTPIRSLYPTAGTNVILDAFIAVIIGGLGSVSGVILASLLIGVVQSLSVAFVPQYVAQISTFLLLIVVLIFRPQGIFASPE